MSMPEPNMLFARFQMEAESESAARTRFETCVTYLVKSRNPGATTVASKNHNDWGIDTFVGSLAGNVTMIWQSKFFLEWGDSSMGQVRASFNSAIKRAASEGFSLDGWTLVVPCVLDPKQLQSFQAWAKRQERAHKLKISLWQGDEICSQLLSVEASHVRREYFPWTLDGVPLSEEPVAEVVDADEFAAALFVRQLHEAGHVEVNAACGQYFATHALLLDLAARGSDSALQGFSSIRSSVHGAWEDRFNEAAPHADSDGRMRTLVRSVMNDALSVPDPPELRLAAAHKRGVAHQLVERGEAGWVLHWRDVVQSHAEEHSPAPAETVASAAATQVDDSADARPISDADTSNPGSSESTRA